MYMLQKDEKIDCLSIDFALPKIKGWEGGSYGGLSIPLLGNYPYTHNKSAYLWQNCRPAGCLKEIWIFAN